uniref:CD109 antigen-like n=1 Tax=Neogobius melanostomus TaxID=47308 RepID=A0A8C6SG95_9GOBI
MSYGVFLCISYSSGQPVHGTVVVTLMQETAEDDDAAFALTQTKEIYGSTQFHFSKEDLGPLNAVVQRGKDVTVHIHAVVTGNSTVNKGIEVTKQVKVRINKEMYRLTLDDYPHKLMPGMEFFAKLKVSRSDLEPLRSEDVQDLAVIEVTQRNSHDSEPTPLTHSVPADGIVHLSFRLQAGVEELFIQAKFQSSVVTLNISNSHPSPTGSFIQISPISSTQIGSSVQISVKSSVQPKVLHYVVTSRGQVAAAGTKEFGSFSLTPTKAWVPQACVTVYCVLADGEIMSYTTHMMVTQQQISLSWSIGKAQAGERVTLSLTGPESGSEVGIAIMGMHDSAPERSQEADVEQECTVRMLTNGKLYETQPSGGSYQDSDMSMKHWHHFMDGAESLLWLDATMSDTTWTSEEITVPDGVNSLRAAAFVMSQRQGLSFTSQKLSVSKDFSLSLNVPPHLIRGEEIVLEINIINHLNRDLEVILLLAESDAFEFVLANRRSLSVVNAQRLLLNSHVSAKAMFPVRLTALGEVDISVDAVSAEASESLVWTVLVKPEGVEESVSENLFLEIPPTMNNVSMSAAFSFPAGVIPDTRRAHLALGGDLLALSIHHLDSLVDLPIGNGEQNMVHFAPSIYILQYLKDDASISSRIMKNLEEGYQRQLSYQRSDGSFGAFGARDSSGSTWLTAFVVKCFHQAQDFIKVDQGVLTKAREWLLSQQGAQGEFIEAGAAMHTEMQEDLDNGTVALTAYVLMALLEKPFTAMQERYADKIEASVGYLEDKVTKEISNYSLSLAAYALALAGSSKASAALKKLNDRADVKDGTKIWMSSGGTQSHDHQPYSVQIEITAYVLLTYSYNTEIVEAISLMKWLTEQRNHRGGFISTQATVVAVQALAHFAVYSGAFAIDLRLKITSPTTQFMSIYHINSSNYHAYQGQELTQTDINDDLNLDIYMEGRGFATFQMNIFYSLDSKTFSENLQHVMNGEAFVLNVELHTPGADYDRLQLSACMRLKDSENILKTGMAVLDVSMLSGFTVSPGANVQADLITQIETLSDKVLVYLHSLTTTEVCITLPLIRIYKVARIQDAVVRVYDYTEPMRKATRLYNLDDLRTLDPCVFCGQDCELCMPGVSITVSNISPRSAISTTYSLSCLLVTAPFMASYGF